MTELHELSSTETLEITLHDDGVCVVALNRPQALNAMNGALVHDLWQTFRAMRHDARVRAVVLTGAGDRAFCVGADLKERREMSEVEVRARIEDYGHCFRAIETLPKPVVCAINGFAFGGGLELALACDMRVVGAATKVGLTELRLGIIPGAGGTQRLPRLIGAARAKELIFTGARITGERAGAIGLVNDVVAEDAEETPLERAIALAQATLHSAPIALAQAKLAIDAGMQTDLVTGLAIEGRAYAVTIPTEDRLEGLAAFKEKRAPQFKGR